MASDPLRIGLYDAVVDSALRARVEALSDELVADLEALDKADVPERIARLLGHVSNAILANATKPAERAQVVAHLRAAMRQVSGALLRDGELEFDPEDPTFERLLEIRPRHRGPALTQPTRRPATPLADSTLLVNAPGEPALAQEIKAELASADRVDLLIAFVKWSGIRLVADALEGVVERGGRVRVLTSTYTGVSDARAVRELARTGADVRISFDNRRTRLHAKSWILHRDSGATTAYIGSSNLSRSAMLDGLEWNVRLSALESPALLDKITAAFESHWESEEFQAFDPEDTEHVRRLEDALTSAQGGGTAPALQTFFDLKPYGYQQSILDTLEAERARGHTKNLVVAPTGVGKTMVAAFDYMRLGMAPSGGRPNLLFVAHRERILDQSLESFRHVLKDGTFGEKLVGGHEPSLGTHVFASVQSLHAQDRVLGIDPEHFDVVIIDEFHHAEAPTYERILEHLAPSILVGLTATPERHDGRDVTRWFDGRVAYDMRLWDALELGLLAPFHYFGIHDNQDLSQVAFTRGRYAAAELEHVYTGNDARVALVLKETRRYVADPGAMRALGFCVSVDHARFMARRFSEAGIPSKALTGESDRAEREAAIRDLETGGLSVLFTVDLFNEGVDIPSVDTVLFLRPTESATVFLQQLGRGLRLHPEKSCLTVLDFIGNAHAKFRFDLRYRALVGGTAKQLREDIEADFPYLPAGCAMQLDRVAKDVVLENIRQISTQGLRWLRQERQALPTDAPLSRFLRDTGITLEELYDGTRRSYTSITRDVYGGRELTPESAKRLIRLAALIHVNDDRRVEAYRRFLSGGPPGTAEDERLGHMLVSVFALGEPISEFPDQLSELQSDPAFTAEAQQLLGVREDALRDPTPGWQNDHGAPLAIHGRYRQEEVLAGLGIVRNGRLPRIQSGVFFAEELNADLFFVTLRKTEKGFSPKTMYRDYAISPTVFHWESQHATGPDTAAGRRYLSGESQILLFVRQHQKLPNGLAEPYAFLGPATLRDASGDRPMQFEWSLEHAMPAWLYREASVVGQ